MAASFEAWDSFEATHEPHLAQALRNRFVDKSISDMPLEEIREILIRASRDAGDAPDRARDLVLNINNLLHGLDD